MHVTRSLIALAAATLAASMFGSPGAAGAVGGDGAKPHPVSPGVALPAQQRKATADRSHIARALSSTHASGASLTSVTLEVRTRGGQHALSTVGTGVHALGLSATSDLSHLGYLAVTVPSSEATATIARLSSLPDVVSVSRAILRHPLLTPTDPLYASGQATTFGAVHAPAAWDSATGTGETIAVIDGGFDVTHPDLAGKVSLAWDVVGSTTAVDDPYAIGVPGHGTATASVAAASTNNGIGLAGAAPNAHLMLIKVSDSNGAIYSNALAAGIVYAVDHGADVLSISLGSSSPDAVEAAAVAYALSHGVVVVAAAGNSADTALTYPAADTGVIAVGATNVDGTALAAFSTYGSWVDVAAPGESITVAVPTSVDPSGYAAWDGTSFAAPIVAGEAAVLLSRRPTSTQAAISTAITTSTNGANLSLAHGVVQFDSALAALPDDTVLTTPAASASVTGSTAVFATSGAPQVRFDVVGTSISTTVNTAGGVASTTLPTYGLVGAATIRATGCASSVCAALGSTAAVTVTNTSPVLTSPLPGAAVSTSFVASATAGGGGLRFLVDGATSVGFDPTTPYSITVDTTALTDGNHTVTAVLCDMTGTSCDTDHPSSGATVTVMRLRPRATLSPSPFSPNADRRKDSATLTYILEQRQSVTLRIYGPTGALVRGPLSLGAEKAVGTYTWAWNGRNNAGAVLGNGAYRAELTTSHAMGVGTPSATTVRGLVSAIVRIDLSVPRVVSVAPSAATFYPYKDTYRDTDLLGATASEALSAYIVTISNSKGVTVRSMVGAAHAAGRIALAWNGRSNAGLMMPAGVYRFRVMGQDIAGNRALSAMGTVSLSSKKLYWHTASAAVQPHASAKVTFIGYCSGVFYDDLGWTGSLGYYSDYYCDSYGDAAGEIAAVMHSYTLPAALLYGSVHVSAYGTSAALGYPDVAALIYYDNTGTLSDVGMGLGSSEGTYTGPSVAAADYLTGGRTLSWLAGTAGYNWSTVKTFTVTWRYAVLA